MGSNNPLQPNARVGVSHDAMVHKSFSLSASTDTAYYLLSDCMMSMLGG